MLMKFSCIIVLIVFTAMGSVRAQDIEPQYIPRPSTTEGPEKDGAVTVTENSNTIRTTKDSDQTDLLPTTTAEADVTTTEVIRTTTDVIPTTNIAVTIEGGDMPTEGGRTTTDFTLTNVSTVTTSPEKVPTPRPEETPSSGGAALNCRIMLISERPYYNWILGVIIVPKTCSYCCAVNCIQKCIEIEPFYCIA